jgi:phage I-like protein
MRGMLTVIASAAKQSIAPRKESKKKEWIASSLSLLAMTSEHTFAISQRDAPEVCSKFPPSRK